MWNQCEKTLQFNRVYNEGVLTGIFIESLPEGTGRSLRSEWDLTKSITALELGHHATSLTKLHLGSPSEEMRRYNNSHDNRKESSGCKSGNANSFKSSGSSSIPSSLHTASQTPTVRIVRPIGTQQQLWTLESIFSPSPTKTIDYAPICRFCPAASYPTT